jgi:hypothetical protein
MASMILVPNITHAYFQSKGEESDFLRAGYKVNWSKNENTFVLYDNFNSGKIDNDQILFPKSKFFVSADLISIAFPMPIVFYSHTTTENAVADLLYANLKLKKLMEEYEKIQARSKKVMKEVKASSSRDFQYFFQQRNNTDSIYTINTRLKESSFKIIEKSRKPLDFSTRTLLSNRSSSFRPSFSLPRSGRGSFKPSGYRPSGGGKTTDNSIGNGENRLSEGGNSLSEKDKLKPDRRRSDGDISDFANTVNKIILYLINHKGEAVFYIIGLYFILLFFSAIFRR